MQEVWNLIGFNLPDNIGYIHFLYLELYTYM